jgi:hypothetical protein
MPDFNISIDIYLLTALLGLAMLAGFRLRSRQLAKRKRQFAELESDMIQAHAELLESQKDYCELESRVKEVNSPVIPIKKRTDIESLPNTGKSENF